MGYNVKNVNVVAATDLVLQESGISGDEPSLPLIVDIHCWLNGYYHGYNIAHLAQLVPAFTVQTYQQGYLPSEGVS